ncbi:MULTISPECIES: hypothetical protein [Streptomyces]|uniref:hypothetical protein n=1 Tax=Streptomyces TaxID=1883 RepID=UPI001C0EB1C0|nr:hypothetical protein [Streptomyces kasugaensis]
MEFVTDDMTGARYEVVQTVAGSGAVVGTLPATAISFTNTLNAAGVATVGIPLDCPQADPESLAAGLSGIAVLRDGAPVWGGILWALDADIVGGTLALNASGYHSHYKGRHFADGVNQPNVDQGDMIKSWLDAIGQIHGINTDTSYITSTGARYNRKWSKYELKNVAEAIEELSDNLDGFIFRYMPYWTDDRKSVGNRFLMSGRRGTLTQHVLEHRVNCNVTGVTYDSTAMATRTFAVGADKGNGEKLVGISVNTAMERRMPRRDIVTTYSDLKETRSLQRKSDAALVAGRAPVAIPSLTLYPGTYSPEDFTPGDVAVVRVDSGYVALYDEFVVTECKTDVDAAGRETISLALANRELFSADTG